MTLSRTVIASIAAVVALLGALLVTVYILDGHGRGSGDDRHNHADPLAPEDASPDIVTRNALTLLYSWNPGSDESSWTALHRAAALTTGPLAAAAATPPDPAPRPIGRWADWARDGDTVTGAVTRLDPPRVDGEHAEVDAVVAQTILHARGGTDPYRRITVTVRLSRVGGTWLVASYREKEAIK